MKRNRDEWDRKSFMQLALSDREHLRKLMDTHRSVRAVVEASKAHYEESLRLLQQVGGLGQSALIVPIRPPFAQPIIVLFEPTTELSEERANSN